MIADEYRYMWAYGSNLDERQMRQRCRDAIRAEPLEVENLILRFRGVADVASRDGAVCQGGLWLISPDDEHQLDIYEGVRSNLYRKCYFNYEDDNGQRHKVLYYRMNRRGIMPPSEGYLASIVRGYRDFGLNEKPLRRAVEHSWRRKDTTPYLEWRRAREGKRAHLYKPGEAERRHAPEEQSPRDNVLILPRDLPASKADVVLRRHPKLPLAVLATPCSDKAMRFFDKNIKVPCNEIGEWLFKYEAITVAGLLEKRGLTVEIK